MSNLQDFFATQFRLLGLQCAHDTVETSVRRQDGILRVTYDPDTRLTTLDWEPNGGVTKEDYAAVRQAVFDHAEALSPDMGWEVEWKGVFVKGIIGWAVGVKA